MRAIRKSCLRGSWLSWCMVFHLSPPPLHTFLALRPQLFTLLSFIFKILELISLSLNTLNTKYEKAKYNLKKWTLKKKKRTFFSRYNLAHIKEEQGDSAEAVRCLTQAIRINPDDKVRHVWVQALPVIYFWRRKRRGGMGRVIGRMLMKREIQSTAYCWWRKFAEDVRFRLKL